MMRDTEMLAAAEGCHQACDAAGLSLIERAGVYGGLFAGTLTLLRPEDRRRVVKAHRALVAAVAAAGAGGIER